MGRPVTINGRELNINDAPFIEANAEYSVTVDDDGTVMVERTDLKAENARLKAKADAQWSYIEKLKAELSHCTEKSRRDYDRDLDIRRSLATENAKLREMVAALWGCCAWETDSEGWCEECDYHDTEEGGCKLEKSLRELKIEVQP